MTDDQKIALVTRFCNAWGQHDIDAIFDMLAADCFYHNMPVAPLVGHDEIRPVLTGFFAMAQSIHFEVCAMGVATNGIVLTERVDHFLINDQALALPVMGAFEIVDGKIALWRDYYDQKTLDTLLTSALPAQA